MPTPLLLLQAVQVVILWTHDWVPLGPLNDVRAVRRQDTAARLVRITALQSAPFTFGLVATAILGSPGPDWLRSWLWGSYLVLFIGELRAWWWPYLIRAEPARAARYRLLFGRTHAVLPERHGMVPNTLHCLLHLATVATLVLLGADHRP